MDIKDFYQKGECLMIYFWKYILIVCYIALYVNDLQLGMQFYILGFWQHDINLLHANHKA